MLEYVLATGWKWPVGDVNGHTRITSVKMAPAGWEESFSFVYIGMPGYAGQEHGYFGKPWACLSDSRGWQVAFVEYMKHRISVDAVYAGAVASLHGKTLVCFCKYKKGGHGPNQFCHGDALAKAAEYLYHEVLEA